MKNEGKTMTENLNADDVRECKDLPESYTSTPVAIYKYDLAVWRQNWTEFTTEETKRVLLNHFKKLKQETNNHE